MSTVVSQVPDDGGPDVCVGSGSFVFGWERFCSLFPGNFRIKAENFGTVLYSTVQAGLPIYDNCLFEKMNPFQRSNLKFQTCSMHRISKGIHIRFRRNYIMGIGDFCQAILIITKRFSTKTQLFF